MDRFGNKARGEKKREDKKGKRLEKDQQIIDLLKNLYGDRHFVCLICRERFKKPGHGEMHVRAKHSLHASQARTIINEGWLYGEGYAI